MTSASALSINVHVARMRPFIGNASQAAGDQPMWSPMSSSLIAGKTEAVLVDTVITFDQVDLLADWAESHDKRITAILITHGDSDHWIGLARLLERFTTLVAWLPPRSSPAPASKLRTTAYESIGTAAFPARSRTVRCFRACLKTARSISTGTNSRSSTSARATPNIPRSCTPPRSARSSPATSSTTRST
jgi:glyoxylase-like metal-dependent hydrolase (beta-lactamase superfamily II)